MVITQSFLEEYSPFCIHLSSCGSKKKRMDASWEGGTLLLGRSWEASSEAREHEGSRLPDAVRDKPWMRGCWSMPGAVVLGRNHYVCFAMLLENETPSSIMTSDLDLQNLGMCWHSLQIRKERGSRCVCLYSREWADKLDNLSPCVLQMFRIFCWVILANLF